jgi:S-adenosylmethionine:tRNA ribosyltransferase-isomerase
MHVDELHYELPSDLVAHEPLPERTDARLLVLAGTASPAHANVHALPDLLPPRSLLVLNDTRVLPARLLGNKSSGGRIEVFLLERRLAVPGGDGEGELWDALVRSSKGSRVGDRYDFGDLQVRVESMNADPAESGGASGVVQVRLRATTGTVDRALRAVGTVPLPPYIRREATPGDVTRYQTVFARHDGSVAAPTAGLHFTHDLLDGLRAKGHTIQYVTLHVGLGTFRPVTATDLDAHVMHEEAYAVSEDAARAVAEARRDGRPVVAVGTTVVRTLESACNAADQVVAGRARTRLLIQPGYRFRAVDALLTNFHLPNSTLLALVMAFAGAERTREAYKVAIENRYRFFSYGDAMLVRK